MNDKPDPEMALRFFYALFPSSSWLHFRAVPEPADKTRRPTNHWYQMDGGFPETLSQFLDYCRVEGRAAFFLPAITVPGRTHKDAVETMNCLCADFDRGAPQANLWNAEDQLGPADIVVESGGVTAEGWKKLHAYWRMPPVSTREQIKAYCDIRKGIALSFGGDPCFKQEAQVIRVPGSLHLKTEPTLVRMIKCP